MMRLWREEYSERERKKCGREGEKVREIKIVREREGKWGREREKERMRKREKVCKGLGGSGSED